jgi:hypothetical protein
LKSKIPFWLVVLIALGIYVTMLAWSLPKIVIDADGLMPFDMRPGGYTLEEAQAFLAALSHEGNAFYRNVQQMLDMAFPAFEALAVGWAIYLLAPFAKWRWLLALSAVPGMLFDYLENSQVETMLKAGADGLTAEMVKTASFYTEIKSTFVSLSLMVLVVMIVLWFMRRQHGVT